LAFDPGLDSCSVAGCDRRTVWLVYLPERSLNCVPVCSQHLESILDPVRKNIIYGAGRLLGKKGNNSGSKDRRQ
jgi:hypothetical protein